MARPALAARPLGQPVARRMASDAGFDLRSLAGHGSGPDGRIVRVDVERALAGGRAAASAAEAPAVRAPMPTAAPRAAAPPEAETVIEPSPMLKAVARRMAESKAHVPHFYLQCEIDMGKALALREELNAELGTTGEADGQRPDRARLRTRPARPPAVPPPWIDDKLHQHSAAHVGVAVALDEGPISPSSATLTRCAAQPRWSRATS
jgi:pyruvate dehydrogenase E2 component (dihydrolipoamide acetyltransferase)